MRDWYAAFRRRPLNQQVPLALAAVTGGWALLVAIVGGVNVSIAGVRVRSTDWSRPATIAVVSLLVFLWLRRRARPPAERSRRTLQAAIGNWLRAPGNLLLVAILTVAAVVRFWALTFGLPHPSARPDEDAITSVANHYFHGHIEQTIFTYPPLFMLVVAAAFWLLYRTLPALLARIDVHLPTADPTIAETRIIQRALSAASGVVSVWLLFRIATRLFGRQTAFVAATFFALAFLHVRDSHFGVTDIPMTCMLLAAFLAIVRLAESGSRREVIAAAIWTGLAVATKYNAALLILPASFAILTDPARPPIPARLLRVVAFGAIMTAVFVIVCPFSIISYQKFLADVKDVQDHLAAGHGPDLGRGWIYHLTTTLRYGLGWPLLASGLVGLVVMIWREGRRGVLVALFPIAYYLVTGSGRTVFARYALPLVPFLCLTAGYLVATVADALTRARGRPAWRIPATAVLTTLVVLPSALSVITFDRLIAVEDSRVLARRWIEARFAPGTTIAQLGPANARPYIFYEPEYVLSDPSPATRPTLVIVASSPMGWASNESVTPWLEREYDLQFVQQVVDQDDRANIYDLQDEFFVPLAGFHRIARPGPNLRVYVRRGAMPGAGP